MSRTLAFQALLSKSARNVSSMLIVAALITATHGSANPAMATLSGGDLAIARQAVKSAEGRRFDEVERAANQMRDPVGAKLLRWMALGSTPTPDFERTTAFLRQNPGWPNQIALRRQAERALPDYMPTDRLLAWFAEFPPLTTDGFIRQTDAMLGGANRERAITMIRARWVDSITDINEEQSFLARFRQLLTQADHRARADQLLWARNDAAARRLIPLLGQDYANWIAARAALQRDDPNAIAVYNGVPRGLREDPGLLHDLARYHRRRDNNPAAEAILVRAIDPAGNQQSWWAERNLMTRRALERGDHSQAYRLASTHAMKGGSQYAEAEFLSGFIALRFLNRPSDAFTHFQRLYGEVSSPISKARGAYWSGRASAALGRSAEARRWFTTAAGYGTTFYGQLAAHDAQAERIVVPKEPAVGNAERSRFESSELVRAARAIAAIRGSGSDQLVPFLRRLSMDAQTPVEFAMAARLARELGRRDMAVAASKDAAQREIYLTDVGYPRIDTAAKAPELALIHAIIRQESTFNSQVVSSAGARGLMQLMPGTAQQVADRLKVKHTQAKLTADPAYNVRLGSAYLQEMVERFNGSYILAIASYNAGPNRVRQWLDSFGDPRSGTIDPVDWLELIPFTETRNYVQRVMEGMIVYRSTLAGGPARLHLHSDLRR